LLRGRRKSRGVALEEGLFGFVWVCGGAGLRWREKKRKGRLFAGKPGRKAYFVPTLSSSFANRLSMKIDPIYRAGQRVISSSMGKTSQPLIRLE
jgi:hypothetical protein